MEITSRQSKVGRTEGSRANQLKMDKQKTLVQCDANLCLMDLAGKRRKVGRRRCHIIFLKTFKKITSLLEFGTPGGGYRVEVRLIPEKADTAGEQ